MSSFAYKRDRPVLLIEAKGGESLGNCYSAAYSRAISTRKLSKQMLTTLFQFGFFGSGQELIIRSRCDGKEEPTGTDEVPCVRINRQGQIEPGAAINPHTGQPYAPSKEPYYAYEIEVRCDTSD